MTKDTFATWQEHMLQNSYILHFTFLWQFRAGKQKCKLHYSNRTYYWANDHISKAVTTNV